MSDDSATTPATVWAIVSLLGHKQYAGRLSEEEKFGGKLGRLDIPTGDGFRTLYFGAGSIYGIDIVSEDVARAIAGRTHTAPVHSWDFPKQLTAGVRVTEDDTDECDKPPF